MFVSGIFALVGLQKAMSPILRTTPESRLTATNTTANSMAFLLVLLRTPAYSVLLEVSFACVHLIEATVITLYG